MYHTPLLSCIVEDSLHASNGIKIFRYYRALPNTSLTRVGPASEFVLNEHFSFQFSMVTNEFNLLNLLTNDIGC